MRASLSVLLLLTACGGPAVSSLPPIEAPIDAGADAAVEDAGSPLVDAGIPDAGTSPADAGTPHAEAPEHPCTDTPDSVYLAPLGPTPVDDAARGDRDRCALDTVRTLAQVQAKIATATSGVTTHRISYWTKRGTGAWATSSARVWLPQTPLAYPLPVVVVAHPSVGVADGCAPSKDTNATEDLTLSWAAKGYAVIAPDFAGLGTDGVQAYVDNRDTAQSVLDGARALRKLHSPATFDQRIALVGYSQGGGAVIAAQGLERTYGSGGKLTAVVAFAPQLASRLDSFGTISLLRNPNSLTISTGYTKPVISVMRQYGYFATYLGPGRGAEAFPAARRTSMVQSLESLCLIQFGGWVQGTHVRLGDLVDDALRTSTLACLDTPNDPACKEPGKSYLQYLKDNLVPPDGQGAPVLYVQGSLDTVMPPLEELACNVPRLKAAGVDLQLCVDSGGGHANVVDRNGEFGQRWAEAKLSGTQAPTCAASQLAPCPP